MIYIGIDPGKLGAIAWLGFPGRELIATPVPLLSGRGAGEYDLSRIAALLRDTRVIGETFATVELLPDLPPGPKFGGMKAARARGVAEGWAWMLTALGIPYELVKPQRWQRVMLADIPGDGTKARSIIAAQRLFPGVSLLPTPKCRKPSDGMADALLLAEFGRRTHGGA